LFLKEGHSATPESCDNFFPELRQWQLPDAIVFVEAIPRTSVGKFKKIDCANNSF